MNSNNNKIFWGLWWSRTTVLTATTSHSTVKLINPYIRDSTLKIPNGAISFFAVPEYSCQGALST